MEGERCVPFRRLSRQPPGIPVPLQTPPIVAVIRDQWDSEPEECKPYRDGERSRGLGASFCTSLESLCSLNIISVPGEVVGGPCNAYLSKSPPVGVRESSAITSSRLRPRP